MELSVFSLRTEAIYAYKRSGEGGLRCIGAFEACCSRWLDMPKLRFYGDAISVYALIGSPHRESHLSDALE